MSKSEFQRQVKINRYKLDSELVKQPQLYYDWALKAADASKEVNDIKHDLDIAKAKVEKRIRSHPEKYGLEDNPKEGSIKATITTHKKVQRITRKLNDALYNEKILNDARTAFTQRRKMLENLTTLNIQLHFADVRIPQQAIEASGKEVKRRMQRKLKRRD